METLLPGITLERVPTSRLTVAVLSVTGRSGPDVLWLRGADDVIVSDTWLYDLAYLGSLGAVPGWPGPESWPPQPMVAQTRFVLDGYGDVPLGSPGAEAALVARACTCGVETGENRRFFMIAKGLLLYEG